MFNIPDSCFYNKKIPKEVLYKNIDIKSNLKNLIIDEIDTIVWTHKISKDTINIRDGKNVNEIEVISIKLKKDELSDETLKIIDKNIPYRTVFCLIRNDNEYKLKINFKNNVQNKTSLDLSRYYETDWQKEEPTIKISEIDIDNVYYEIFKNISGISISDSSIDKQEDIKKVIENNEEIEKINKEIEKLRKKRAKEVDDNDKQQINIEIKHLLNKINELKGDKENG